MRILLLLVLLCAASCHWERSWKWGSAARTPGEVPAVTVRPPEGIRHNSWTPVLHDLLTRRRDVRLVNTGWRYSLWIQVEEGYLSLVCHDASGRLVAISVVGSDRFVDREQGAGKPEGAANTMRALQQELDRIFREEKGGR